MISHQQFKQLHGQLLSSGGFTANLSDGSSPSDGIMVSDAGAERTYSADSVTPRDLAHYARLNRSELSHKDKYLGAWHQQDTGTVFLDVSRRYTVPEEAKAALVRNKQYAGWDIGNNAEVLPDTPQR